MRIVFLCDERANQIAGKPVIYDQQNGKLVFEWKTPYACPPLPSHCSFLEPEKNHFFDISPLRKTDGTAYLAMDLSYMKDNGGDGSGGINERQVYANACGELYPTNQNTFDCPYGSAVCEPSKNLSYGMASNMHLQMDESGRHLQMIYRDGSDCDEHSGKKWSSIFNLFCNQVSVDHDPRLLHTKDCVAEFEWSSPYACWLHSTVTLSNKCSVTTPNGEEVFDFTSLATMKPLEVIESTTNETYLISICGNVDECCRKNNIQDTSKCDISACRQSDGKTASHHSGRELKLHGSEIEMLYKTTGKFTYSIDLVCDKSAGHMEHQMKSIKFDEGLNIWYLEYRTSRACPPMAGSCSAHDNKGNRYDLSELNGKEWIQTSKSENLYHLLCKIKREVYEFLKS